MTALSRKDVARQTVEALERHNLRLPVIHERAATAARLLHLRRMTFKRLLPAWLDELRPQLTDWVVIAYEAGAKSMDEFRGMRFSINGEALTGVGSSAIVSNLCCVPAMSAAALSLDSAPPC